MLVNWATNMLSHSSVVWLYSAIHGGAHRQNSDGCTLRNYTESLGEKKVRQSEGRGKFGKGRSRA